MDTQDKRWRKLADSEFADLAQLGVHTPRLLWDSGVRCCRMLRLMSDSELLAINGIGEGQLLNIRNLYPAEGAP